MDDLDADRRATAEAICMNFDFGYPVKDASPWEWTKPGTELTRAMFFDDDAPGLPAVPGTMTVRFAGPGSFEPVEAFATVRGEQLGNVTGGRLADYVCRAEDPASPRP